MQIHAWLAEDADLSGHSRLQRDRQISEEQQLATLVTERPREAVLQWWQAAGVEDNEHVERINGVVQLFGVVLLVSGMLLGIGSAALALRYDGSFPVSLIGVLVIFVLFPGLLLVLTLLSSMPLVARTPGVRFGLLGSRRWLLGLLDRYMDTRLLYAWGAKEGYARCAWWLVTERMQWFAVGFFVGALANALFTFVTTDIAFGWSSTLDLSAEGVWQILHGLAIPWAAWLPAAAPSLELVEISRFFKLEEISDPATVAELGSWWPFVLMCIAVWGLLPRLVLLLVARRRIAHHAGLLVMDHPEIAALLDRLATPAFDRRDDSAPRRAGDDAELAAIVPDSAVLRHSVALMWNAAPAPQGAVEVGSLISTEARAAAIAELSDDVSHVYLYAKGWEPPVLSLTDVVQQISKRFDHDVTIVVKPAALADVPLTAQDLHVWRAAMAKSGLSRLYVDAEVAEGGGQASV